MREALLEAALAQLEEGGLATVSLRGVARRTGVSQAAPYSHFKNKQDLLAAVATLGFERFAQSMQHEARDSVDDQQRALALARGYVKFALENPALFRLMFGSELCERFAQDAELAAAAGASYGLIEGTVAALNKDARKVTATTTAAWALVHGMATLLIDRKIDPERLGMTNIDDLVNTIAERLRLN